MYSIHYNSLTENLNKYNKYKSETWKEAADIILFKDQKDKTIKRHRDTWITTHSIKINTRSTTDKH